MRRREFIALLGGAAAVWPIVARAQQAERMRRIGVLMNTTASPEQQTNFTAFQQALQQLGWNAGRNVQIEIRWAEGDPREIRKHAGELVALAPDVIVATGNAGMAPLLQATRTIPIVFNNIADPVGGGFVKSMSRPGGNATGFIQFEYSLSAKWLETLKEIEPRLTRVAVLRDATHPGSASSPSSSRWRRRSEWRRAPSTCATPARSSPTSRTWRAPAMEA